MAPRRFSRLGKAATVLFAASFVLAACGNQSATSEEPASSGESDPGGTTQFTIGTSGLGINHLPYLIASDRLREEEGWEIFLVELSSGDLVVQGVASGEIDLGNGQLPAVLLAQELGSPLTMVAEFARNTWTAYASPEFESCEALGGAGYAVHALTSFTYFYPQAWIEETCPGNEPEWLIVPGSENRLAALLTGEIDATSLELADAVSLLAQSEEGDYVNLVNFADALDVMTGTHWGNTDFMKANRDTVTRFIEEVVAEHRKLMGDAAYFEEQLNAYLPEYAEAGVAADIVELYTELAIFPADGGMTPEGMQSTLEFLEDAEVITGGLEPADVMDRSYLEQAIENLDN